MVVRAVMMTLVSQGVFESVVEEIKVFRAWWRRA